jgi:predicted CoA-substrate-specific enzyme activase
MYTIGIDIGSTTSKCVILEEGRRINASSIVIAGAGTNGAKRAMTDVLGKSGLSMRDISYTVVTGYGRKIYDEADEEISELSCHATGCHFVHPLTRTIIDIGGQDAKAIRVDAHGRMENFIMNDKCAAGTGRFLDVMASILQINVSELEIKAMEAERPAKISSTCTVFAESEVISQLASGENISNIVAGICNSVASRVAGLVKRVGVREQVFMSGGVANNAGVRLALEKELGQKIYYSSQSQLMGAIGAAMLAHKRL